MAPVFVRVTVAEVNGVYRPGFPPGGLAPTIGAGRGEMYIERGMIVGLLSENVVYGRPKPNSYRGVILVAPTYNNIIVISHSGGIMLWVDKDNVTAIISAHFSGQEIGNSIDDVL